MAPSPPKTTPDASGHRTRRIASHIRGRMQASPEDAVLEKARHHLLDTLGAMISGTRLPAGEAVRTFLRDTTSTGSSTVVATGLRAGTIEAAMANAMAAHADETDDAHPASITHPGCSVVPAALALGEATGASGLDVLKAIIAGYDVCGRIGTALGGTRFLTQRGFDPHAYGGTFGAAAAAAALVCRSETEIAHVLSYAAQQASGLATVFRDTHHVEKAFVFAGMPARNGVTAALMVRSGWPGVADVFDTPTSFLATYAVDDAGLAVLDGIGDAAEITRTNIKRWSVGSPAQAILDSIEALLAEHRPVRDDIAAINLHLPLDGARVVDNSPMPSVCVQHLAALMIVDGTVGFQSSHDHHRMSDSEILAVRSRVTLHRDDALTRAQPARQGIAELQLHDGRVLRHHTREVRGTWANPMTAGEVEAKARDLITPILGTERFAALIQCVRGLDREPNLTLLMTLIA